MALDEGDDVGVIGAAGEHITLPMTWDGASLSLGWALADGDHVNDLSLPYSALRPFGDTHLPPGAQMCCQFILEHPRD